MLQTPEYAEALSGLLLEFAEEHNYNWQTAQTDVAEAISYYTKVA
jgi:hypothetical protein